MLKKNISTLFSGFLLLGALTFETKAPGKSFHKKKILRKRQERRSVASVDFLQTIYSIVPSYGKQYIEAIINGEKTGKPYCMFEEMQKIYDKKSPENFSFTMKKNLVILRQRKYDFDHNNFDASVKTEKKNSLFDSSVMVYFGPKEEIKKENLDEFTVIDGQKYYIVKDETIEDYHFFQHGIVPVKLISAFNKQDAKLTQDSKTKNSKTELKIGDFGLGVVENHPVFPSSQQSLDDCIQWPGLDMLTPEQKEMAMGQQQGIGHVKKGDFGLNVMDDRPVSFQKSLDDLIQGPEFEMLENVFQEENQQLENQKLIHFKDIEKKWGEKYIPMGKDFIENFHRNGIGYTPFMLQNIVFKIINHLLKHPEFDKELQNITKLSPKTKISKRMRQHQAYPPQLNESHEKLKILLCQLLSDKEYFFLCSHMDFDFFNDEIYRDFFTIQPSEHKLSSYNFLKIMSKTQETLHEEYKGRNRPEFDGSFSFPRTNKNFFSLAYSSADQDNAIDFLNSLKNFSFIPENDLHNKINNFNGNLIKINGNNLEKFLFLKDFKNQFVKRFFCEDFDKEIINQQRVENQENLKELLEETKFRSKLEIFDDLDDMNIEEQTTISPKKLSKTKEEFDSKQKEKLQELKNKEKFFSKLDNYKFERAMINMINNISVVCFLKENGAFQLIKPFSIHSETVNGMLNFRIKNTLYSMKNLISIVKKFSAIKSFEYLGNLGNLEEKTLPEKVMNLLEIHFANLKSLKIEHNNSYFNLQNFKEFYKIIYKYIIENLNEQNISPEIIRNITCEILEKLYLFPVAINFQDLFAEKKQHKLEGAVKKFNEFVYSIFITERNQLSSYLNFVRENLQIFTSIRHKIDEKTGHITQSVYRQFFTYPSLQIMDYYLNKNFSEKIYIPLISSQSNETLKANANDNQQKKIIATALMSASLISFDTVNYISNDNINCVNNFFAVLVSEIWKSKDFLNIFINEKSHEVSEVFSTMIKKIVQSQESCINTFFNSSSILREYFDISSEGSIERIKKILSTIIKKKINIYHKKIDSEKYFVKQITHSTFIVCKKIKSVTGIVSPDYIEGYNENYIQSYISFIENLMNNPVFVDYFNQILATIKNEDLIFNNKNKK